MTTIAWDGKTLAADKQMVVGGGSCHIVTKIKKIRGNLCFVSGSNDSCAALMEWFADENASLPEFQKSESDYTPFFVITPDGIIQRHGRFGAITVIEDSFYASGSGMHYALAVMAMGGDAVKAVEIASRFDQDTGMGIDTLTLDGT